MYSTSGIDAIATITELRSKTTDLIDHVRESGGALLIQKNNEPYAVLLDWETYKHLMKERPDAAAEAPSAEDRGPKRHGRHAQVAEGETTGSE